MYKVSHVFAVSLTASTAAFDRETFNPKDTLLHFDCKCPQGSVRTEEMIKQANDYY